MKVFLLYSPWEWKCPCPWAWSWLCAAPCFNSWLWQWSPWPCVWSRAPLKREWLCPWPKNKVCKNKRYVKMYYLMVTIILTLVKRISAKTHIHLLTIQWINVFFKKVYDTVKWTSNLQISRISENKKRLGKKYYMLAARSKLSWIKLYHFQTATLSEVLQAWVSLSEKSDNNHSTAL